MDGYIDSIGIAIDLDADVVVDLSCFTPDDALHEHIFNFRNIIAELSRRHIYIPLQFRALRYKIQDSRCQVFAGSIIKSVWQAC